MLLERIPLDISNKPLESCQPRLKRKFNSKLVQSKKFTFKLIIDKTKKKGILVRGFMDTIRVIILHINPFGDVLIQHNGCLMMSSKNVIFVNFDEKQEGKNRFLFIKSIYESLSNGNTIDILSVYVEVQKWLL